MKTIQPILDLPNIIDIAKDKILNAEKAGNYSKVRCVVLCS